MPHSEYIKTQDGATCALLFIHGILSTPRYFDPFLSAVPEGWDIYNILLDGHGGTVGDFSRTSMEKWQAQTTARLKELCLHYNKVVVAAHSLGTLLAINEAPRHPKVTAMLLLDVPLMVRVKPSMAVQSLKAAFGKLDANDPWERALREKVSITLTRRLWQYLGWVPRFLELLTLCRQTRDRVGDITVPCHVFHARQDELVSMKSARYFQGRDNLTHEVLEHSGHNYIAPEDGEKIVNALGRLMKGGSFMTIKLTKEEALVLSDWLFRNGKKEEFFSDDAEQYVMWKIEAQLDKMLVEPFMPNYSEILEQARAFVKENY